MPPKKQEQKISQYKPCVVLPIFVNGPKSASASAFLRPINIKKNIDNQKLIEVLKNKGLTQAYITNGQINQKGREFICTNNHLKTVLDQLIAGVSKPPDPKKDAKKDAKKQAKKQEPVATQNVIPTLQLDYQKNVNDFYILHAMPSNGKQLQQIINNIKIDIVTAIKEKVKPGSRKPNYQLLNNNRSIQDMSQVLKSTNVDPNFINKDKNSVQVQQRIYDQNANQMVEILKKYRSKINASLDVNANANKNIIILEISYQNDLSKPQNNETNFLKTYFQRVCKCTKQIDQYNQWKSTRKLKPMIQPIKQITKKQVLVEDKNDKGKKGGKATQPVYQTVEEVVQKPYENFPENIKSDLKDYLTAKRVRCSFKQFQDKSNKDDYSIYKQILNNCLECFTKDKNAKSTKAASQNIAVKQQHKNNAKQNIQIIGQRVKNKFQSFPINKITDKTIINSLRDINYFRNASMNSPLYFQFPVKQTAFSFMQLLQKSHKQKYYKTLTNANLNSSSNFKKDPNQLQLQKQKQELRIQYIINKLQNLAKQANSKIKWNFSDRYFVQRFTKEKLQSVISQQILYDPEIFTGYLQTEGLKLLILSRTNPPGRALYHNSVFDWKVIPDFQNWTDHFLKSQSQLGIEQFFNYSFQDTGNLSIKAKNMMPTDNTVIRDQTLTIGSKKSSIIQLYKDLTKFGLTKKSLNKNIPTQSQNPNKTAGDHIYVYWHDFDDQYRLRVFKNRLHIQGRVQNQQQGQNNKVNKIQKIYSTLALQLQSKGKYITLFNPNPTIFWTEDKNSPHNKTLQRQVSRRFGNQGQITSYRADGSIHIYKPNGDVSIYRNGKWTRIVGQQQFFGIQEGRKLQITVINEGQKLIKIRQDQTIIITDSKQTKQVIFPDGTQVVESPNLNAGVGGARQKKIQIKNPNNGPYIRICLARDFNLNVIGFGSAFAYLGFKNILQRSYDGYLFQYIDHQITSHYYIERFDKNGTIHTEQVRLITYRDSSIMKINLRQGNIVYVSPSKNNLLTQQLQNERWLQTFTTPVHHGQGVFDIDLNQGHIENKDAQTNKFVAKVDQKSQSHIAVSFITEQQQDSSNFPNGFHIKQQNYFLPPPTNCIPARIFTINYDGSGCEYLNKQQLGNMGLYNVNKQHQGYKNVLQYSLEQKPATNSDGNYMNLTFSQPIDIEKFGLPDILRTQQTKQHLIPAKFNDIKYRVVQQIQWNSSYENIRALEQSLREEGQEKRNRQQKRKKVENSTNSTVSMKKRPQTNINIL